GHERGDAGAVLCRGRQLDLLRAEAPHHAQSRARPRPATDGQARPRADGLAHTHQPRIDEGAIAIRRHFFDASGVTITSSLRTSNAIRSVPRASGPEYVSRVVRSRSATLGAG